MRFLHSKITRLCLDRDEVHLWWGAVDVVESLDEARAWLSDEECRRSERFRRERDARAFLFRRVFRRWVLARYVGGGPAELTFTSAALGKPALDGSDVRFNASSSGAWALVGVTRGREIGVDVERHDPRLARPEELSSLARRVLNAAERTRLEQLPSWARMPAFLRAWARKEACLKALGIGLGRDPRTLEVGLDPWDSERTLGVAPAAADAARFPVARPLEVHLRDVEAPDGFAACCAVEVPEDGSLRFSVPALGQPALRAAEARTLTLVSRSHSSSSRRTLPGIPPTSE